MYTLDKELLLPIERYTWAFDIAKANKEGIPDWTLFTDWKIDYEMQDLSPSSYFNFALRL